MQRASSLPGRSPNQTNGSVRRPRDAGPRTPRPPLQAERRAYMRSSKSRSRGNKNRNNRPSGGNIVNRVFDSSGPDGKVRGTPQQIIEKYTQLHRDAQLSGDRVAAENFAQHAEHYRGCSPRRSARSTSSARIRKSRTASARPSATASARPALKAQEDASGGDGESGAATPTAASSRRRKSARPASRRGTSVPTGPSVDDRPDRSERSGRPRPGRPVRPATSEPDRDERPNRRRSRRRSRRKPPRRPRPRPPSEAPRKPASPASPAQPSETAEGGSSDGAPGSAAAAADIDDRGGRQTSPADVWPDPGADLSRSGDDRSAQVADFERPSAAFRRRTSGPGRRTAPGRPARRARWAGCRRRPDRSSMSGARPFSADRSILRRWLKAAATTRDSIAASAG